MFLIKNFFSKLWQPLFLCFVYTFLYLPIVVLAVFSFNDSAVTAKWVGFSLRWYRELLYNPELLTSFQTSLIVALAATLLSLILGSTFVFASMWWKGAAMFNIFYINIVLPDIILAISVLSMFVFFNLPIGYGSLITGHTLLALGFVIPILRVRFAELDPVLTEASLDLGATYSQTFVRVHLPLMFPSLLASALLAFTLSLDDFLISFFCSSPSVQTLSVYVYSLARTGIDPTINAISTGFIVVSSVIIVIISVLGIADQVLSNE